MLAGAATMPCPTGMGMALMRGMAPIGPTTDDMVGIEDIAGNEGIMPIPRAEGTPAIEGIPAEGMRGIGPIGPVGPMLGMLLPGPLKSDSAWLISACIPSGILEPPMCPCTN